MLRDLRHAVRFLLRRPSLAVISVLALGIGIGLTLTMFSIVYGAMFRGLPFEHAERITYMWLRDVHGGWHRGVGIHQFTDWRAQQRSSEELAAYVTQPMNISGMETPELFGGARVTSNTFHLLRT